MVRSIVGTLLEIGRGKPLDIKKILKAKDRNFSGPTVPACGLYLAKVKY
jgi:tRNA pseudouridine38-40 synthase